MIEAIADAVRQTPGAVLLDVDPGEATNRTVYTFAASPEAAVEAAFQAIRKGSELIDMQSHKGSHARQGACDVCPFVPISGVTMEDCAELARKLGKRVGDELGIPVYLYAEAAARSERKRLPDIRVGEYEALEEKLKKPEWKPDFGTATFNAKAGATTIGARAFLIAYNVNLNSTSVKLAKEIAFTIRVTGRLKRDAKGEKVIGPDGKPERVPGMFKNVQATGWLIPEYNRAQVTINILDIDASPIHLVYDACCDLATKLGCRVTGSEVVGMVPKKVLIEAGHYFLKKQGSSTGISEDEVVRTAIMTLGLSDVAPFDPTKKIIEERFLKEAPLASMSVKSFSQELSSNSPAPGGGSVAAFAGALSAGLSSMVAALTFEKKGFEERREEMEKVVKDLKAQKLDRKVIERQERILSRLLDAQKSIREKEYSKKRQAEREKHILAKSPPDLKKELLQREDQLRKQLMEALEEGYSQEYRELIKLYYENLSRKPLKSDD